ncbi:hypothetical protein GCM10009848_61200 [Micromonospora lupini]
MFSAARSARCHGTARIGGCASRIRCVTDQAQKPQSPSYSNVRTVSSRLACRASAGWAAGGGGCGAGRVDQARKSQPECMESLSPDYRRARP